MVAEHLRAAAALTLRYSALRPDLAERIEAAVQRVLVDGSKTPDIAGPANDLENGNPP
jgi:isocitrate/isopropylmalate dehydrogenase